MTESGSPTLIPPDSTTNGSPTQTPGPGGNPSPGSDPTPAVDAELDEVVYVINDWNGGTGWCTGALVAKDIVLTAGHCVDTNLMTGWEVVAPRAQGKPRIGAAWVARFRGDYDDPAVPDIGLIKLDAPINLPHYAQLTDVSARVDAGETVEAMAVVRTSEEPESPLKHSQTFKLSSAVHLGYEHGFHTPMFSIGGDSGTGLFLVEKGKRTHKLIGVARQPEPDRNIDHFTRIDATITKWFAAASTGGGDD